LRFALYGGQAVTHDFLEKLQAMAPLIGSGLGLTETAGFVTYTPIGESVDEIAAGIGFDMPLCPLSIRDPIKDDGFAGDEKAPGEVGEITFSGPQIFLGYLNSPENTAKTISKDGFCYTGDLGTYDEKGLHFSGRSKLVIKPKGYQVFPTEVEDEMTEALKGRVGLCAAVGVSHEVFSEAIMFFVEKVPDQDLTVEELEEAAQNMAAYKRPSHYEILEPGTMPLNRVAKVDYMALKERANQIVEDLRANGGWDQA
jgi:acyl-CoA synthetase (AMP-forming)/AMP-acid ligase II